MLFDGDLKPILLKNSLKEEFSRVRRMLSTACRLNFAIPFTIKCMPHTITETSTEIAEVNADLSSTNEQVSSLEENGFDMGRAHRHGEIKTLKRLIFRANVCAGQEASRIAS